MELLNKCQSRAFQFALQVMAALECAGTLSAEELNTLAAKAGLDYADLVLKPLTAAGLVTKQGKAYSLGSGGAVRLPMGAAEREYLAYILSLPEAELFLDEEVRALFRERETGFFAPVRRYAPEKRGECGISGQEFRTLLAAINGGRMIRYRYRTRDDASYHETQVMPWKLEYSAYDGRWWVILYDKEQKRTIKAVLGNLQDVRLGEPARVSQEEIEAAMDSLLAPEPVVLQVKDVHKTLERCFLVFENQLFEKTEQLPDEGCRIAFRYYRFDETEILRRLLYLGPNVRLVGPAVLREKLADMVEQALSL